MSDTPDPTPDAVPFLSADRKAKLLRRANLHGGALVFVDGDDLRALLAEVEAWKDAMADAILIAELWSLPGPGGIDITGGIPVPVHLGIGRDTYESEYEVAKDVADAAREEIPWLIRRRIAALAAASGATATGEKGGQANDQTTRD